MRRFLLVTLETGERLYVQPEFVVTVRVVTPHLSELLMTTGPAYTVARPASELCKVLEGLRDA